MKAVCRLIKNLFGINTPYKIGDASPEILWTVTRPYDEFNFCLGRRKYSGILDTGSYSGIIIQHEDFEELVRSGVIKDPMPEYAHTLVGELAGFKTGKGEIEFHDDNGKTQRTTTSISSFPDYIRKLLEKEELSLVLDL
jgi:hypothetical protein